MAEFGSLERDCATDFYCAGGAAEAVPAGFHRYILLNPHGGESGIRTHEGLRPTGFQDQRTKPGCTISPYLPILYALLNFRIWSLPRQGFLLFQNENIAVCIS